MPRGNRPPPPLPQDCSALSRALYGKKTISSTMLTSDATTTRGREITYPPKHVTPERIYERARVTRERGPQFFKSPNTRNSDRDAPAAGTEAPYHRPPRTLQHPEQGGGIKRQQERSSKSSTDEEGCEILCLLERIELESEPSRRAYSCGTLKLLSAKPKYQKKFSSSLDRVLSVSALVLRDVRDALVYDSVITKFALDSYYAMRSRILSLLVTLVHEPAHRIFMFNCEELITELVKVLKAENKADREKALTCFAHFAKHTENRTALVKIEGLMDFFSTIITPSSKPKLMAKPTKHQSLSDPGDEGIFELDSFGRIVIEDETRLSSIDGNLKHSEKRNTGRHVSIDYILFVPDEDFSVEEESPPRKKNNRKCDRDTSLLFGGSEDEEEAKDMARASGEKGHKNDSLEDSYLENSRECVLAILVHLSKEKECAVSSLCNMCLKIEMFQSVSWFS